MATMDVFNSSAFSMTSMTAAVDKLSYTPTFLYNLPGLIVPVPVTTEHVFIEARANGPAVIQTTPRGADPINRDPDARDARAFKTVRVAEKSRIKASEVQGIRAFGSETELQTVQTEVARRQMLMRNDMQLTFENLTMGMVQGLVKDADGSTLFDWASLLGQTIPDEIPFNLTDASPASGAVRRLCDGVTRSVLRGLRGLGGDAVRVIGLCGDTFWDDLTANEEVRQTFLNTQEASQLRTGTAFGQFSYGGITFINYRGTDDGSTVGVNTDLVKFFPVGAGIFQWARAPGESIEVVNTFGQEVYSMMILDPTGLNEWAEAHMRAYPLPVCTMPQALARGKRSA